MTQTPKDSGLLEGHGLKGQSGRPCPSAGWRLAGRRLTNVLLVIRNRNELTDFI